MAAIEHNCECGENLWIITERDDCDYCPENEACATQEAATNNSYNPYGGHTEGCYLLTCKTCSAEDYIPRIG
jgi:hypothetical protein